MSQISDPEVQLRHMSLLTRWYHLRKRGLCVPIIQSDSGLLYTFDNLADPWGSRNALTWVALEEMILMAERKPPASEFGGQTAAE